MFSIFVAKIRPNFDFKWQISEKSVWKFPPDFLSFIFCGSCRRDSQLSNALGLVKKCWKLAFLWRFENFLSLLVRAKKGLFGPYIGFLRLKTPEKCCLRLNFKVPQTIRFLLFFAESFTHDTSNILLLKEKGGTTPVPSVHLPDTRQLRYALRVTVFSQIKSWKLYPN